MKYYAPYHSMQPSWFLYCKCRASTRAEMDTQICVRGSRMLLYSPKRDRSGVVSPSKPSTLPGCIPEAILARGHSVHPTRVCLTVQNPVFYLGRTPHKCQKSCEITPTIQAYFLIYLVLALPLGHSNDPAS